MALLGFVWVTPLRQRGRGGILKGMLHYGKACFRTVDTDAVMEKKWSYL
jgi:hypothetical protein